MCAHHRALLSSVAAFQHRLDSEVATGRVTDELLTTGYAHALELDAEGRSYDRALAALRALGDDDGVDEARGCQGALLGAATRLRDALASARRRRAAGSPLRGPSPAAS